MKYDITALSCRVCLEVSNKQRSVHRAIEEGDETPNEMLQQITGILFDEDDYDETVPKSICKSCELALNLAYQFRIKALNSQKIIQKHCNYKLKSTENNFNTIVKYESDTHVYVELDTTSDEDPHGDNTIKNQDLDLLSNEVIEYEIVGEEFIDESNLKLEEVEFYTEENDEVHILSDEESNSLKMDFQTDEESNIHTDEGSNFQTDEGSNSQNEECQDTCKVKKEKTKSHGSKKIKKETNNLKSTAATGEGEINNETIKNLKRQHDEEDVKPDIIKNNISSRKFKCIDTEIGHICDICGNTYAKRGRLMEHRRLHNKELKYFCELCPNGFYQREMLRKHMFIHKGGKPYKCSFCSRTFFYESVRKAHEDVHKGHKPYVCEVCNKAFAYAHTLKKHELIHADIKLYHCNYCDKDFRLQHHMKQHEETKLHQNAVAHATF